MAVVASIFTGVLLLVTIAMRNRIHIAVNVFEEASRALAQMPVLFLSPLLTYVFLAFLVVWVYSILLVVTTKDRVQDGTSGYVKYEFGDDPSKDDYKVMLGYSVFALLWNVQFILACGSFVVSGTVVSWYFAREEGGGRDGFVHTIWTLTRYHLGSVALGSLIIAIIQAIRLVLSYIQNKFQDRAGKIGRFIMCMCQCCLWCFEKCMKFINANAYIVINVHGYNFCHAAWIAFSSILHNLLLVGILNAILYLVTLLCKVFIASGAALLVYAMLGSEDDTNVSLWAIVLFVAFGAWLIADTFLDLYGMIIDTVLMCFLEDKKWNDGTDSKPYHCTVGLKKFLHDAGERARQSLKHPHSGEEEGIHGKNNGGDGKEIYRSSEV